LMRDMAAHPIIIKHVTKDPIYRLL
jgi:hypothetical protein